MIQHQGLKQLGPFVQSLGIPRIALGPLVIDLSTVNFLNYQYLFYGLALVGMMLLRPEGLFPSRRRRQELHAATADVEATAVDAVSEA
jgi:branched-chain amino acid transport system permease protein